ncbi:MAG: Rieske (2Fe-2S) protein [Thiotrichaceae bacterium]|nr:Rieske (2Fe-2S) protein [Thiotrichaceae bacterium]
MDTRLATALSEVRALLLPYQADVELLPESTTDMLAVRWQGLNENEQLRDLAALKLVKQAETLLINTCPELQQIWHYPQAIPTGKGAWYAVAPILHIPRNGMHLFEIKIENKLYSLLFSRLGMKVTCFNNQCSHLEMPLDHGKVSHGTITCPFHGYQFCLETGNCFNAPGMLVPHAVRVGLQGVEVFL